MRKSSRFTRLVSALPGAMVLLNNLGKPLAEALHGPDVLRLVASGMLFRIGLAGPMGKLNSGTNRVRGEDQP